ncbi:MAG: hypothetical protein RIB60_09150 [Phycisphaerales bacterium]
MKLTRERKIFFGVLLAAVGALLVDQLVLGPPQSASADPVVPQVAVTTAVASDGTAAPDSPSMQSLAGIAQRVRQLASSDHEITDAFLMPESWEPETTPEPEAIDPTRAQDASGLTLSAVLPSASGGVAIINGVSVRAGEAIPGTGYRLLRVGPGVAVVTDGQRAIQVRMADARYMSSGSRGGAVRDDGP